eukprot:2400741-Pyramimonas_sp.AAC.1
MIIYERESIEAYIKQKGGQAKCPHMGTVHTVRRDELQPATNLLRERKRRQMAASQVTSPGVDCRPANDSLSAGNIFSYVEYLMECSKCRALNGILVSTILVSTVDELSVDVELKSKAFLAVDSGACQVNDWRVS